MKHFIHHGIALGCLAGLAVVNGCGAPASSSGSEEAIESPVAEAQEADSTHDTCNTGAALQDKGGTCARYVCTHLDPFCCNTLWDSSCVNEALSFCPAAGFPVSCTCHSVCTTGDPNDYGCPGRATFFPQCTGLVCDQMPSCCSTAWTSACVVEANRVCSAGCFVPPTDGHPH